MSRLDRQLSLLAASVVVAATSLLGGCAATGRDAADTHPSPSTPSPQLVSLSATGATPDSSAVADDTKVRCIYQANTGSRIRQRLCRTEAEWKMLTEAGQQAVRDLQKPVAQGVEGS